jgi:cold shock CspA family protein/ribosome-associated translation inhibitor RaiA
METEPEVTFHNMRTSEAVKADILKRIAKLEKFYGRLTFCRVSIEARTKQHRKGNIYDVHIEMRAPGGHLAVSRAPHHVKERRAHPTIRTSIIEAFDAAEAQLRSFNRKQHGEVKVHAAPVHGQVSELFPDREYGFILTNEGARLYFHRNSLMNGDFDKLQRGDEVHFVEGDGDTGPTAVKVWPVKAMSAAQ